MNHLSNTDPFNFSETPISLQEIRTAYNHQKFKHLIKTYFEKVGATAVFMPTEKDAIDLIVDFNFLKSKIYVTIYHETEKSPEDGGQLINYKLQEVVVDQGYSITHLVISSATYSDAESYDFIKNKGGELIDGLRFVAMLSDTGFCGTQISRRTMKSDTKITPCTAIKYTLNKNYRFENLIKGDSNRLACSTGLWVSRNLGNISFNPLVIVGGIGFGKTHLANAIGNTVKENHPDKNVLYISTNDFIREYIQSIKNNTHDELKKYFLSADVIIMEDIQHLSGRFGTQEIITEIVNYFIQSEKQIILTADKELIEMNDVSPHLLSRFRGGLSVELLKPNYEIRLAVLKDLLPFKDVKISEEIMEYVARNIESDMRVFQGCFITLLAQSYFSKQEITFALAKEFIEKLKR